MSTMRGGLCVCLVSALPPSPSPVLASHQSSLNIYGKEHKKREGEGMKTYPGSVRCEHVTLGMQQSASRRDWWELVQENGKAQGMSVTFFRILPLADHLHVRYLRRYRNNPSGMQVSSSCQRHGP